MAPELETTRLAGGAWYRFDPAWLHPAEATALQADLVAGTAWEERAIVALGAPVIQPRLIGWAGEMPYTYSGQTLEPRAATPSLTAIWKRVAAACEVPFDHVVLNLYRDGLDHVGFHADNEPVLGKDPLIASLSLGATRMFLMRPKWAKRKERLRLTHGSLLVMGGKMQHTWRHAVPKQPGVVEPRVNLTFRRLTR